MTENQAVGRLGESETRCCRSCGEPRPVGVFRVTRRNKSGGLGYATRCRPCEAAARAAYRLAYPDRERRRDARYEASGRKDTPAKGEARRAYQLQWKRAHRASYKREDRLVRKYGMSLRAWEGLFESQGCRCAICGGDTPKNGKGWSTDHDHATGRVRGILCGACNVGLGMFGDSTDRLRSAISYLESRRLAEVGNG